LAAFKNVLFQKPQEQIELSTMLLPFLLKKEMLLWSFRKSEVWSVPRSTAAALWPLRWRLRLQLRLQLQLGFSAADRGTLWSFLKFFEKNLF
jgi:hypothetical protein